MVTDEQVRKLRQKMSQGQTQEAAAAATGMSERTARTWQQGPLPSQCKPKRNWRTRADPFAGIWDEVLVPLLRADTHRQLEGPTLLEVLRAKDPARFADNSHLRSLQRRVQDWRALEGPPRAVVFRQEHPAGREGAFDFTHCTELGVTIAGELLVHLVFVLVLPFSGWGWTMLAFGETFEAMLAGIQGALAALRGVPAVLRSDNLSAATHELKRAAGRGLTRRYQQLLTHYGTTSTRIAPGKSQENGTVENGNGQLKSALAQALILRGSSDFEDLASYEAFVETVTRKTFREGLGEKFIEEQSKLGPLPSAPIPSWSTFRVRVSRSSLVEIGKRHYSVPSRLMGCWVEVRLHPDHLEVRYREQLTATMPRLHGNANARIDYRHLIWSLVQKPGAFARYRFREELFPTLLFRRAYDALGRWHGARTDVEYLRVLHLAASTLQSDVEVALELLLSTDERFDYAAVRALASPVTPTVPELRFCAPDLRIYDALLVGGAA